MIKFRFYFDKDTEEVWLNQMSQKGWAFKKYFLGFYTFEPCEPGEYHYQIDLLDNWEGNKEAFAAFMEEIGVKVISQWYRWVYIQKEAADGPFEMYTDTESKIAQYDRMKKFFSVGLIVEAICFIMEINAAVRTGSVLFWGFTILLGALCLVFLRMVWKCKWKIDQLKHDLVI